MMPAKLIRTVVLNLSFVRLAQDKGDIVASVEIRLEDIKGGDVSEDIWCAESLVPCRRNTAAAYTSNKRVLHSSARLDQPLAIGKITSRPFCCYAHTEPLCTLRLISLDFQEREQVFAPAVDRLHS